jgi:N-acetylglucosaminyldiphosphoundecaprenol N-acetyl-beta-D-mannosaminyltransferase
VSLELQPPAQPPPELAGNRFFVLGTPLTPTSYADLTWHCHQLARRPGCVTMEFTNTHIVTLRRHDRAFRELTSLYDHFIPDATPLVWCLNRMGANMPDRVYGPTFMRECLDRTTADCTHYLMGGSAECGARLRAIFQQRNPNVRFVSGFHGRCSTDGVLEGDAEQAVLEEINRVSPDFIWVGLGTPRQQAWIKRHKHLLRRGVVLTVGFAFDVNAGTKPDAPPWMQRLGLTWLFRMASEPRRLVGRYCKFNSLFLFYLFWDGLKRQALVVRKSA